MKSLFAVAVAVLITLVVSAEAAESPVSMTHTLTGYSKGQDSVALVYVLHLVNTGQGPLTDLSLSLVRRPPLTPTPTSVNIARMAPQQSADVVVKLETRSPLDREVLSRIPLLWAGECLDAQGNIREFPVKSNSGGGK